MSKMPRFSFWVTRMDRIRNEHIRGTAKVVQRRDSGEIGQRKLMLELPSRRKRERPKRRFMHDGTSLLRDNTLSQVVQPYETVFDP